MLCLLTFEISEDQDEKNFYTRGPWYTCLVLVAAINLATRGPLYTCLVLYAKIDIASINIR